MGVTGERNMKKRPLGFDFFDEPTTDLRDQDAESCRRMKAAIESGREACPIGVSTEPGTTNPVIADGWKHPPVRL